MRVEVIIFRLFLAIILSGLIGIERQNKNRPAGFRTHILVCVGAALTMMISENLAIQYGDTSKFDPTRLGAQVISGIGFLGAGTIIRDGASVRGLTTAATLWSVATIGLAVGVGFYWGAISAAVLIFLVLILLSRFGNLFNNKSSNLVLNVLIQNTPGKIGEIGIALGNNNVSIRNMEFLQEQEDDENEAHMRFTLQLPFGATHNQIIESIKSIDGVLTVEE